MRPLALVLLGACAGPSGPDAVEDPLDPQPFEAQVIGVGANGSDGADACEFVEEECPTDCVGNVPPWVGEPVVVVDGLVGLMSIPLGAQVKVAFPFRDDDDNLRCGTYVSSFASPENQSSGWATGSLCSNQPGSSEDSGMYVGWTFTVTEPGFAAASLRLLDACSASSERWTWEATVPTPAGETIPAPVMDRPADVGGGGDTADDR